MKKCLSEEATFLHDIAGPLGASLFLIDYISEVLKERRDLDPEIMSQLDDVFLSLRKIETLLTTRRENLVCEGEDHA